MNIKRGEKKEEKITCSAPRQVVANIMMRRSFSGVCSLLLWVNSLPLQTRTSPYILHGDECSSAEMLASPDVARYLFSFVLCNWRWLDRGKCRNYPRSCVLCHSENTSWHILFDCPIFNDERALFQWRTATNFNYQALLVDVTTVARCAAETGMRIFEHLCRMTV